MIGKHRLGEGICVVGLALVAIAVAVWPGLALGQQTQPYQPASPPAYQPPASPSATYPPAANPPAMNPPATNGSPSYTPAPQNPPGYGQPQPGAGVRPAAPQPPFQLTPEEQNYVDRVLFAWEKYSDNIKTFQVDFTLRTYGSVFANPSGQPGAQPPQPVPQLGAIKYEKPDKGYFEVNGDQPEKWICDGTSMWEFNHTTKELVQHVLPPEERGQAIQNSPLPFIFGAKADTLRQRYWIRALPSKSRDQIWLQALPKYARDAENFLRAEMIVSAKDLTPIGIQMLQPNGKEVRTYAFQNVVVNKRKSFIPTILGGEKNPFEPSLPSGWRKVVEPPASAQTNPGQPPRR